MTTAAGAIPVCAPRVNDRRVDSVTGQRQRFASAILPAWARKSPKVAEVLPLLYLHGLSSGDFGPALEQFLGSGAGLSAAATSTRLTKDWQDEVVAFNKRSLAETEYVYVWVDGIHLKVRLEQEKVCLLVMIGVRADGTKEWVALDDGHRESTESWLDLLRSCKRRGMRAPVLAVGDGALGFWAAVREVFPEAREQRCWFHKIANVLNWLPKSAQPAAEITDDLDVLLAFKCIESAQVRWRTVNAPHLVALVRAGVKFEKGKLVEETTNSPTTMTKNQEVTLAPRDTPIQRA